MEKHEQTFVDFGLKALAQHLRDENKAEPPFSTLAVVGSTICNIYIYIYICRSPFFVPRKCPLLGFLILSVVQFLPQFLPLFSHYASHIWVSLRITPPPKILPAAFLFVGLISSGLPEKSVTWLPEIISGELIPWDYWKVWPGLSAV